MNVLVNMQDLTQFSAIACSINLSNHELEVHTPNTIVIADLENISSINAGGKIIYKYAPVYRPSGIRRYYGILGECT